MSSKYYLCTICNKKVYHISKEEHEDTEEHIVLVLSLKESIKNNDMVTKPIKSIYCKFCKIFVTRRNKYAHIKTAKHNILVKQANNESAAYDKEYLCKLCNKSVKWIELYQHERRHEKSSEMAINQPFDFGIIEKSFCEICKIDIARIDVHNKTHKHKINKKYLMMQLKDCSSAESDQESSSQKTESCQELSQEMESDQEISFTKCAQEALSCPSLDHDDATSQETIDLNECSDDDDEINLQNIKLNKFLCKICNLFICYSSKEEHEKTSVHKYYVGLSKLKRQVSFPYNQFHYNCCKYITESGRSKHEKSIVHQLNIKIAKGEIVSQYTPYRCIICNSDVEWKNLHDHELRHNSHHSRRSYPKKTHCACCESSVVAWSHHIKTKKHEQLFNYYFNITPIKVNMVENDVDHDHDADHNEHNINREDFILRL